MRDPAPAILARNRGGEQLPDLDQPPGHIGEADPHLGPFGEEDILAPHRRRHQDRGGPELVEIAQQSRPCQQRGEQHRHDRAVVVLAPPPNQRPRDDTNQETPDQHRGDGGIGRHLGNPHPEPRRIAAHERNEETAGREEPDRIDIPRQRGKADGEETVMAVEGFHVGGLGGVGADGK